MLKILLVSHGRFAEGIKDAAEIIMGKQENLSFINAYTNDVPFEEQLGTYLSSVDLSVDKLIIVADLFGGSVNQKTMLKVDLDQVILVTGLCLPLLLELLMLSEDNATEESVRKILEVSKEGLLLVRDKIKPNQADDFDF
ncbi:PTS sugar transporter subunit IIA [Gottschalkiaceae bacterium SANA]|nr:PTS sugar transporter subunit IIA [Gottschalkiaceae bacterium SANA]